MKHPVNESSANTLDKLSDEDIEEFRLNVLRSDLPGRSFTSLENALGLTSGYIHELFDERDDWAFIIKLGVIVEATLSKVINAFLQNPLMEKHVRSLPMGGRTGKIQLARDLGILGPKSMERLQAISEIRNDFAHSLGVVQLSIAGYFSRSTRADAQLVFDRLFAIDGAKNTPPVKKKRKCLPTDSVDQRITKPLVWVGVSICLSELSVAYGRITKDAQWRSALVILGEAFIDQQNKKDDFAREKMKAALNILEQITEHASAVQTAESSLTRKS